MFSPVADQAMNQYFPRVEGRNLLRQRFDLPADFGAELNVVLLCFTMAQQLEVNTWLGFLQALRERAALEIYELPTLPRYGWLQQTYIDGVMRQGIPDPHTRATTITLYTDLKRFAQALELPDLERSYTLLVTRSGAVLHREAGAHSLEKAARLELALLGATRRRAD